MTVTATLIGLALGTYALKSAAPLLLGGRSLPRLARLGSQLPAGLLAALVVVSTFSQQRALHIDARAAGLVSATAALVRRAPLWAVVLVTVATTAVVRAA